MPDEVNNTPDGQADESQLNSPAPEGAVSNGSDANPEPMTLAELNEFLGKDFKDKTTALKSLKDTYSYVGKRKEDIARELGGSNEALATEIRQIKENAFYKDNPDFAPYRAAISKMGANPEEVVNTPEFKTIFEKSIGYDKDKNLKSVLVSNPRLANSKDNLAKAREASSQEERDRLATLAVLETIE